MLLYGMGAGMVSVTLSALSRHGTCDYMDWELEW